MRYSSIRSMDISDGPGIRVSFWVQGCPFHCEGCFNSETWDFKGGNEYTSDIKDKILSLCDKPHIEGLSILGGEPLHPENREEVCNLAKEFKQKYPEKTIWCWTGYKFEEVKDLEVMNYIDVLVDGKFIYDLKDFKLKYKGSSNQRVIDIKQTLKSNKIVFYS